MLNKNLDTLKHHFGIAQIADWCAVRPEWILAQHGIGPKTLDYIRLLLAARGLTLADDKTPEYWHEHLKTVQILEEMTLAFENEDAPDAGILAPFTVVIDSAEQQPWTFQGLRSDADQKYRPLIVPTKTGALGRHPDGRGDYSLDGFVGRVAIERKAKTDAYSTILGWDGRRERFKQELANLAAMDAACVIVECGFHEWLRDAPANRRSVEANRKSLHRSVLSFMRKYHVPWLFCESRRLAEQSAYRFLAGFYEDELEARQTQERRAAQLATDEEDPLAGI